MDGDVRRVGELLREWRQRRRTSQLDLAIQADVSARYVSLVETGRSNPSADMVLRLASALDVPLRHRNRLLLAAGFAPRYRERPLDAQDMAAAREALVTVLRAHEPYPALVVDRRWNIMMTNAAVTPFLEGVDPELLRPPLNLVRLALDPRGFAARIANPADVRAVFRARLARQLAEDGDPEIAALYDTYLAPAADEPSGPRDGSDVTISMTVRYRGHDLRLFSTVTTFGTPQDITLQELAVEAYYPADAESARLLRG
ncbi:helix-turn-helix domain-containing protein [Jiangella sp. DSM 45060]|uniref:helix-turn-helix domain-containing protein n=1 Tax=Jiangella sp. DSM 45060 TaxID=1798224 RepID=UPI000879D0C0|nr:helix-turn-helix transcriptional regulator [Jiangella sp. DSM 45060]SDT70239.1 Helix-turn-helix domain-containing protein [Jiangella sp. DSM 45060]